jgi:hypothetical protein
MCKEWDEWYWFVGRFIPVGMVDNWNQGWVINIGANLSRDVLVEGEDFSRAELLGWTPKLAHSG